MRKSIRRIVALTFAVLLLCSLFPFSCFAVDPVSAATMANALAQAITAYGASNGVSMMYDVSSADGIGEAMHDLWGQFKTDVNDNNVPTYDSLAVTIWSTVFKKVGNNLAINLSDSTVSYLDAFWNWLLSGPAEMQKVDDQYYEWTIDSQTGLVDPIIVYTISPIPNQPVPSGLTVSDLINHVGFNYATWNNSTQLYCGTTSGDGYIFIYGSSYNNALLISPVSGTQFVYQTNYNTYLNQSINNLYSVDGVQFYYYEKSLTAITSINCPSFPDRSSVLSYFASIISGQVSSDGLSVQPYVGDTVPQDVYIPDNEDVNYQPLPYVGPLDIPWDQTWGDGETISDAQGTSIADALDNAIADDGTLTLQGDDVVNPPADDVIGGPDSYQVPGLADVFPFCIPFDIYNFLSALAAQPTAPYFEAELAFPEAIGGTQTIEIDFDTPTWNQLAQLLRLLELLAFIVGLALLTRSMFIRG